MQSFTKNIIYYTDNRLDEKINNAVQYQLKQANLPIVCASLMPMDFGDKRIMINEPRGYGTYFKQIIAALETSTAEIVFFCEHDVLYHPTYFEFTPEKQDTFYYNLNVWRLKYPENYAVTWEAHQVAELCCFRELALEWYRKKLKEYEKLGKDFGRKFEPEDKFENYRSKESNVDIRHNLTLTKSKWSLADFRDKRTCVNWQEGECPKWARKLLWPT